MAKVILGYHNIERQYNAQTDIPGINMNNRSSILIVDDDQGTRLMLHHSLQKQGYTLYEAGNGLQAVTEFETNKPDLVIMDIEMPELNGINACQRIRQLGYADTPIIMITCFDNSQMDKLSFKAGATGFITKPIDLSLLNDQIHNVLSISKLKRELRENKVILKETQLIGKIGNWYLDVDSMRWYFSTRALAIYNLNPDVGDYMGFDQFINLLNKNHRNTLRRRIYQSIKDHNEQHYEFDWPDKHKKLNLSIAIHWKVICNSYGIAIQLRGNIQDVSERKMVEHIIEQQSFYDYITNLPNRRLLEGCLEKAIKNSEATEQLFAILFVDCDRFKKINELVGHHGGDTLLQSIACRLLETLRTNDTVFRVSGDEFAVLLEGIDHINDIVSITRNIIKALNMPHQIFEHEILIKVSIGIAVNIHSNDELLKFADIAMTDAKKNGGNNFSFYREDMNYESNDTLLLERELHGALSRGELQVYYQPQNAINTNRHMVGTEALLRWNHPQRGLIPPDEFISIAENTGMIVEIGEWIIHSTCQQLAEWNRLGYGELSMGINISPRQFNHSSLFHVVEHAILDSGIHPNQLELEITESMSMQNIKSSINTLNRFKSLGVKISLDDFGTGYSSLSYLQKMPIDTLKIDRSFIRNLHNSKKDKAFVIAIITMAHSLGIQVIAEGVENEEQFKFLDLQCCEIAQGYLFSPPVPPEELAQFLVPLKRNQSTSS